MFKTKVNIILILSSFVTSVEEIDNPHNLMVPFS